MKAGGADRLRRGRAEFRLPARHERAGHGLGRRPGAGVYPGRVRLVQAGHTGLPVFVKLTPNITDIRYPGPRGEGRRRRCGFVDQHHQLDRRQSTWIPFSPEPSVGGKGAHGGYCGPAVKPIALSMVSEIARDPAKPAACRSRASAASAPGAMPPNTLHWAAAACRFAPPPCALASRSSTTWSTG